MLKQGRSGDSIHVLELRIFLVNSYSRYALSMGLRSFVDKETIDDMKLLGKLKRAWSSIFKQFSSRPSNSRHKSAGKKMVWTSIRQERIHLEEAIIHRIV